MWSVSTTTKSPAAKRSVDHGTREIRSSEGARKAATTTSSTAATTAAIHTVTPAVRATTSATSTADADQKNTGSDARRTGTGVYRPKSFPRKTTRSTAHGMTTPASAAHTIRPANGIGPSSPMRSTASRFVRFDTGRRSDAVFASHTVVRANGMGGSPTRGRA